MKIKITVEIVNADGLKKIKPIVMALFSAKYEIENILIIIV